MWICTISIVCIIAGVIFYKPYLGIAFVVVSIPFEELINLNDIFCYPLEIVLFVLISVCVFRLIAGQENHFGNRKLIYYYFPFVLCILLSAIKFVEFSSTVKEIVRWLELIVVYYLTINLVNDGKKIRVILYSMILTAAMVSICGVVSYLAGVESVYDRRPGVYSFFGHPNGLAGYVNLIIPVLLGMLMASALLWERISLGVIAVLSITVLFLTFSRTALLSLVLTIVLLFFLTKVKKRVLLLSVALIIIFAVSILYLNSRYEFIERFRLGPTLDTLKQRAMYYTVGFDMVKDCLVLGIGIGNYSLLIKKFTKDIFLVQNHLHGLYLQMFVETGIIGLSAFLFWLVCIVKYLVSYLKKQANSRNYSLFVGLVGGVIVYLFNNLTDILVVHGIHLQWGVILGLAVVLTQLKELKACPKAV